MTSTTRITFLPGTRRYPVWFARIGGKDAQFGLKREFIKGYDHHDGNGRLFAFDVPLVEGAVYQDHVKDFYVVRDGTLVEVSRHNEAEVQALMEAVEKPVAEQPAAPEAAEETPASPEATLTAMRGVTEARDLLGLISVEATLLVLRRANAGAEAEALEQAFDGLQGAIASALAALSGGRNEGYFIALPASRDERAVEGIWGIGRTEAEALADAYQWSQMSAPSIELSDEGRWVVAYDGARVSFPTEEEARVHAAYLGYRAEPCTRALYDRVKAEGYSVSSRNSYGYEQHGTIYDVVERDAA